MDMNKNILIIETVFRNNIKAFYRNRYILLKSLKDYK